MESALAQLTHHQSLPDGRCRLTVRLLSGSKLTSLWGPGRLQEAASCAWCCRSMKAGDEVLLGMEGYPLCTTCGHGNGPKQRIGGRGQMAHVLRVYEQALDKIGAGKLDDKTDLHRHVASIVFDVEPEHVNPQQRTYCKHLAFMRVGTEPRGVTREQVKAAAAAKEKAST